MRLVVVLGLLIAIGPLTIDMYLPALPELSEELGASQSQAQLTLTGIMIGLGLIISVVAAVTNNGEMTEAPKWKPITLVTIGIFVFAALFERTGMFPALVALILIASAGGEEFKLTEVLGNIVVLTILCILVFKVGLSMNISIINGVW